MQFQTDFFSLYFHSLMVENVIMSIPSKHKLGIFPFTSILSAEMIRIPGGLCNSKVLDDWAWGIRSLVQVLLMFTVVSTQRISLLSFYMLWCLSPSTSVKSMSCCYTDTYCFLLAPQRSHPSLPMTLLSFSKNLMNFQLFAVSPKA